MLVVFRNRRKNDKKIIYLCINISGLTQGIKYRAGAGMGAAKVPKGMEINGTEGKRYPRTWK